jgi:hypothetical protein
MEHVDIIKDTAVAVPALAVPLWLHIASDWVQLALVFFGALLLVCRFVVVFLQYRELRKRK